MSAPLTLSLTEARDVAQVGGKAANLGRLLRAGFPVPGGFVVTTTAFRLTDRHPEIPPEIIAAVAEGYRAMGEGLVAVRSSATAEDLADASMAGQYETFLNITGENALMYAMARCWAGISSPRVRAYFAKHGIDSSTIAMAVVVQRQIAADVAGVLFTANPHDAKSREMLVEASWGLGESVVSGRVQPDVLHLEQATGRVKTATIADKHILLRPGKQVEEAVEESRRRQACLGEPDTHRLWELGRKATEYFGSPQDIEWAIHNSELYLLQSRPITTIADAELREDMLRQTAIRLRELTVKNRGPWVIHNLAETLPHPTPLTWSVIRRFMSGTGGFGEMYRLAGFEPSAVVGKEGFIELIAGRIYMDTARATEMFFPGFPFAYDVETLKRSPEAAQSPPTLPRGRLIERVQAGWRLGQVTARLRTIAADFDRQLRDRLFPSIEQYVADARQTPIASLSAEDLIALWLQHEEQVLDEQAPRLLLPSLITGMALENLRAFLQEHFYKEDAAALAQSLSSGNVEPNRTVLANVELYEVSQRTRLLIEWTTKHGHRAPGEFDLAAPRWREQPDAAREMAARLAAGESPLTRHHAHVAKIQADAQKLRDRLPASARAEFDRRLDLARRYIAFREDGKDFFMLGYDLLRTLAVQAGRRLRINDDVFFLTRDEVFEALRRGEAPANLIQQRKREYRAEARIELPTVIDSPAIESLGKPRAADAPRSGGITAFTLSTGVATGTVRIVTSPTDLRDLGTGYILVCPSTDPSWTPLFANAAGLILERGGTLSHGAVVAREMGLPAVVIPDATKRFQDGEQILVDGTAGWVGKADEVRADAQADANDTHIAAELIPPPPGSKDRRAARVRNIAAIVWTLFLLAFFLLPAATIRTPVMNFLDAILWPIVRTVGKPAVVAIVACAIAFITLLLQKILTDNARLLEAKRRATALNKESRQLPANSPRRKVLTHLAAGVQLRTLLAAMVPVGILLGPMVLPFVWFTERIDPAVANAAPGTPVQVVAMIDSNWSRPVAIQFGADKQLDKATPEYRTIPALRQPLEKLLALYQQADTQPAAQTKPWQLDLAPDGEAAANAKDLEAFLARGIPPQGITWLIHPPENYAGRFPIMIHAAGSTAMLDAHLGDEYPPGPESVTPAGNSPIKEVRLVYQRPKNQPFAQIAGISISWLMLYILVYLPILLLARWLLRVA